MSKGIKMVDIENMKKDIVTNLKHIKLKKIILFGSYAYGTPNEESDLDLCIIKDTIASKLYERREIRKSLKHIRIPKDILLLESDYYKTHSDENWLNTALYDIKHQGEVLYEAK